jgi:hypothetical protein
MTDILYKGKFAHELTRDEAIDCAIHFRDVHVNAFHRHAKALRRMAKMEEALTPLLIKRLDKWIDDHEHDAKHGDGRDLWPDWETYGAQDRWAR